MALCLISLMGLGACTTGGPVQHQDIRADSDKSARERETELAVAARGNTLFSSSSRDRDEGTGARLGINAILWRASLDTVSFMPLASADPFGGVIITDWYSNPDTPNERFKITIYILDKRLRADALRVSFFRQNKSGARWVDAPVGGDSARRIEDQILTRARQLRIAQAEGG